MTRSSQKLDRQQVHSEAYFGQFDDLTLAAMAFNLTDDAYDELTHSRNRYLPDDIAWNLAASIANANMAMRVLVLRLSSSPEEAASTGVQSTVRGTLQ